MWKRQGPTHTQQHNPHHPLSTPRYTEPSVPGGHSWALPLPWGPRRPPPLFVAPSSPPFCLCISPGPGLALHLSIYICANALISGPLSLCPSWINGQKQPEREQSVPLRVSAHSPKGHKPVMGQHQWRARLHPHPAWEDSTEKAGLI